MSEYQERYRVSQLIGSPQGYVGYGEGSQLLDALEHNPKTIVLFDEIEKAHPDVLTTLMNAMDAGRLSSAAQRTGGRVIDCRYAMFFFTSNLDSDGILAELEDMKAFDDVEQVNAICQSRLRSAGIRPELIGRIGEFLVFRPLSAETRAEIITLAVVKEARKYGIQVRKVEATVINSLLEKSIRQDFGARPAHRLVNRELGPIFARITQKSTDDRWEVIGPPFACKKAT
jgi:ATP-dependent Clp protease ATP-binding subunit ClpA